MKNNFEWRTCVVLFTRTSTKETVAIVFFYTYSSIISVILNATCFFWSIRNLQIQGFPKKIPFNQRVQKKPVTVKESRKSQESDGYIHDSFERFLLAKDSLKG